MNSTGFLSGLFEMLCFLMCFLLCFDPQGHHIKVRLQLCGPLWYVMYRSMYTCIQYVFIIVFSKVQHLKNAEMIFN